MNAYEDSNSSTTENTKQRKQIEEEKLNIYKSIEGNNDLSKQEKLKALKNLSDLYKQKSELAQEEPLTKSGSMSLIPGSDTRSRENIEDNRDRSAIPYHQTAPNLSTQSE